MKRIVQIAGIVVALLIVAILALPLFVNAKEFKPRLEGELTKALGRQVTVGDLKLALFSGGVTASDLSIADDPTYQKGAFVTAKSLGVKVELLPLIFSRKLNAKGITIDQPTIALIQSATGAWNFSKLGAPDPPGAPPAAAPGGGALDLSVKLIEISDGKVTVSKTSGSGAPLVIDKVNAEVHDFSSTSTMPFALSANFSNGGELKIDGTAGPMHAGDIIGTPMKMSLNVKHLDLALAGVVETGTGAGGLITLDSNATSNGQNVDITGKIQGEQLKLVKGGSAAKKPVEIDFELTHDLMARTGELKRGDIRIGSAAASLAGTYTEQGDVTTLNVNLTGANMPVADLEAMLPALNVVLPAGSSLKGGTAHVRLQVTGPTTQLVATGSLGVEKTTLAGFDMGSKLSAIEKLAGMKGGPNTEIETLSANVKASQAGGAGLDHIELNVPSIGQITGAGTISPANALDFKLSAMVHAGGLLTLASKTAVPVAVKGTASNPIFEPDVKALATQEVKSVTGIGEKAAGGVLGGLFGGKPKK